MACSLKQDIFLLRLLHRCNYIFFLTGRVLYPKSSGGISSKRQNGAFLSSTKRFSKPRDVVAKNPDRNNPGPGKYDLQTNGVVQGGSLLRKESRFKDQKSDVPGPGAYEVRLLFIDNTETYCRKLMFHWCSFRKMFTDLIECSNADLAVTNALSVS